jgi:hypothetical protein
LELGASLELGAWDLKLPSRVTPPKTARNLIKRCSSSNTLPAEAAAILIMGILWFGVLKSELRMTGHSVGRSDNRGSAVSRDPAPPADLREIREKHRSFVHCAAAEGHAVGLLHGLISSKILTKCSSSSHPFLRELMNGKAAR